MLFDYVVGNPPYQGVKKTGGDKGKPPTIWPKFVVRADQLCTQGIVMVHPAMYRKPGNDLQTILFYNCRELHMYNNPEAMRTFGASTRYDWYVLDRDYDGPTDVYFEDGSHHLIDLPHCGMLPNGSWDIWELCQKHVAEVGCLETKKKAAGGKSPGIYPIVHTINKTVGVQFMSRDKKPRAYDTQKVIISESGGLGYYDPGSCGYGSNCYHVTVDSEDEGKAIVNFIQSRLGQHLVESCKWGNFRTESILWHFVPNPFRMGVTADSSDDDIYEAFGLTAKQIKHVETFTYGRCRDEVRLRYR
jgi:hypothetical protein